MSEKRAKRKLTAILSADVKGYSRLMGEDELATFNTLKQYRKVISSQVQEFSGRVVDSPGDNILAEFGSVVDAVQSALKIQKELKTRNDQLPESSRMEFRIGINLGDVIEEEGRIYGDGINIAARVEGLAEGGGICMTASAYEQVKNKLALPYEYIGEYTVKNIEDPLQLYRIPVEPGVTASLRKKTKKSKARKWHKETLAILIVVLITAWALKAWIYYRNNYLEMPPDNSIAVLPFDNMTGDRKQEHLADGISENIIASLSQIPEMFVPARSSTFRYKGKPINVRQVGRELRVRYVLEGSIQRAGNLLRVTAQLIDTQTGNHLWSERYDRELNNIFSVQDEITHKILKELQVKLREKKGTQ